MAGKLSFMKKAKDFQPAGSLKFLLHNHLSGLDKERPLSTIHASDMTKPDGLCPRYYALHDELNRKPKDRWVAASDIVTWDMGRSLQDDVVNHFADMGRVIGHWACMGCRNVHEFCKRPIKCSSCGCRGFKPEEVRFKSAITGGSCGVDMIVKLDKKKLVIVEIKTMIKDQFADLLAPLAEHRLRTSLYLRMIAESGHHWSNTVNSTEAKILYVCKGGYKADPELSTWGLPDRFSPFKEYTVKRDDAKTDEMSYRAQVIKEFRDGTKPMPCGVCSSAMTTRAKKCPVKTACFSGAHPPEYDWMKK